MSLRSSSIYVQPKTLKRMLTLTKLYPERTTDGCSGYQREKTADERADTMLNEAIKEKYPKVIELEKQLSQVETAFLEANK